MNPRQQRFVEEYLVDLNATQAAIRAGYAEGSAKVTASRMLTDDNVAAAIAEAKAKRSERTEITQDMVLRELALIGFANAGDYFDWDADGITLRPKADLTREQQAVVAEVSETVTEKGGTIRLKLHDKRASLVDIGRHLGMFPSRHEVTGKDGGPVALSLAGILEEIDGKTRGLPGDHEQTE